MEGCENFRIDRGIFRGLPRRDVALALGLGLTVALWTFFSAAPGVPPELWEEVAAAAGLRPPASPYPGIWRSLVSFLVKGLGLGGTLTLLRGLGVVAAGSLGALIYLTFRDFLDCAADPHITHPSWRGWIPRMVVVLPTLLLVTSAPVGRLVRFFGPETQQLLMILVALFLLQRFLRAGGVWALYACVVLSGAVFAETPVGILMLGFIVVKVILFARNPYNPDLPLCNASLYQKIRWHISGIFLGSFLFVTLFDAWAFQLMDGWEAGGWQSLGDATIESLLGYARLVPGSANLSGWCAGLAVCIVPYIAVRRVFARCAQMDRPLPYLPGLACIGAILTGYVQFANAPVFWFWSRADSGCAVSSPLLIVVFLYFSALAMTLAMAVWTADLFCRSVRVVWLFNAPEDLASIDANPRYRRFAELLRRKSHWARRFVPTGGMILLACGALPWVRDAAFVEAATLVDEAVKASVDELEGVRWVFTDGRLDPALELEASVRGRPLTALAMIAQRGPRTTYLNLRDVAEETDELLLKGSVSELLKSWIVSDRPQLAAAAQQLGVEMYARARKEQPKYLGLCARTQVPEAEIAQAHAASAALEERVLSYYARFGQRVTTDGRTSQLLNTVQWRLARLLRFRATVARQVKATELAVGLEKRADALDDKNAELKALVGRLNWIASQKGDVLTPREGLKIALARPDFILASRYAATILRTMPDDIDANFAMAMRYLIEKDLEQAEKHFKKVLKVHPKEVTVINNLAIVYFQQGRMEEALRLAEQAKKLAPSSEAVADTLRTIMNARKR